MKVVITGATSMIGISLIKSCISHNVQVLALIRENSKRKNNIPISNNVEIIECNLDELKTINTKVSDYDVFFHLGWEGTDKKNRDDIDNQLKNINYSLEAVRLAKKLGCKRFIGIGSQAEYGVKHEKLNTKMKEEPILAYGIAKLCAYHATKKEAKNLLIDHIWIRVLSVYGKNDNENTLISYLIKNLKENKRIELTKCEQIWDYLYCDDAGEVIFLLGISGKRDKIYNLGSGKNRELKYYVEIIKDIINPKAVIDYGAIEYSENQIMNLSTDIDEITNDTGWKPRIEFVNGIKLII